MSQGPQTDDLVTVSNDGVVVEKTVTAEEFPVPAVALHSRRTPMYRYMFG